MALQRASEQASGGGSAAGVWVTATRLSGNAERFQRMAAQVNRPLGGGGSGGGGRIALSLGTNQFTGSISAHAGSGAGS